jgi:hypothetical protein
MAQGHIHKTTPIEVRRYRITTFNIILNKIVMNALELILDKSPLINSDGIKRPELQVEIEEKMS